MALTHYIKELELSNFKSISKKTKIPLKPITLIFGPNSSGKSSIIQSLLLLKQTLEESSTKNTILLSKGSLVDLGSFKDFVFRNDITRNFTCSFLVDVWGLDNLSNILPDTDNDVYRDNISGDFYSLENVFDEFKKIKIEISIGLNKKNDQLSIRCVRLFIGDSPDSVLTYKCVKDKDYFKIETLNKNHPFIHRLFNELYTIPRWKQLLKDDPNFLEKFMENPTIDELSLFEKLKNKPPDSYELLKKEIDGSEKSIDFKDDLNEECIMRNNNCFLYLDVWDLISDISTSGNRASHINIFTACASNCFEQFLRKMQYLGPFRMLPERYYNITGDVKFQIGNKGESFPFILQKNEELLHKVNKILADFDINYSLKVSKISLSDSVLDDLISLRLVNTRTNVESSIKDVGFGISQLLPVIMQSVLPEESLIVIEQPELHIHPALQTKLGDLFINSSLREPHNKFLIETHSEHLILRILRRIRESTTGELPEDVAKIRPEDLCVLYVEPGENGSNVKEMKVNEEGEFIDWWPGGFFTERAEELF